MQWKRFDDGYWVVLALCVLAIWPFLRYDSLPHNTDAELHIFRLAELQRMWDGGVWYPRWSSNFFYGYGYPIFNFYAPLTYYIGLVFNWLPGFDAVLSVKTIFVLGILGSGFGMYGFVRGRFGRNAAFVAAASYVYSPYLLYIDPHARGVLPETFSFCVFALALWALDSLLQAPSVRRFVTAACLTAAIILTHNLMAMVFGGVLFGYFVWEIVGSRMTRIGADEEDQKEDLTQKMQEDVATENSHYEIRNTQYAANLGLMVFILSVGLSAFFTLPMVLEQSAIKIGTVIGEGSHYDYRNHFLTLPEMFGGMPRFDWGATEPFYTRSLGVAQWVLGLIGFGRIFTLRGRQSHTALFFAFSAVLLIVLMLPISQPIWRAIPLLPFLQFPWRLLGATNAILAVLAGVAFSKRHRVNEEKKTGNRQQITENSQPLPTHLDTLSSAAVAFILLLALPLTQVKPWDDFGGTAASDVLASELAGRWRGTTSTADFVPATVDVEPRETEQVVAQLLENRPIDPLNRATLGEAQVETEILSPIHFRFVVDTAQELVLRFFIFDFPGWSAQVNGEPAAIELATPEGFITVPIPPGQHDVELRFSATPVRTMSWVISWASLAVLFGIALWLRRKPTLPASLTQTGEGGKSSVRNRMVLVIAGITVLSIVVLEPLGVLHYESQGTAVRLAKVDDQDVAFEDKVELVGFDLPEQIAAGETIDVTAYWKAQRELEQNYSVFVHLISADSTALEEAESESDSASQPVAQSDKLNPGDFPTKNWPLDEYVRDHHSLTIPTNLPPGDYELRIGFDNRELGQRLLTARLPQQDFALLHTYTLEK